MSTGVESFTAEIDKKNRDIKTLKANVQETKTKREEKKGCQLR